MWRYRSEFKSSLRHKGPRKLHSVPNERGRTGHLVGDRYDLGAPDQEAWGFWALLTSSDGPAESSSDHAFSISGGWLSL